jgi:hypothetical protein
MEITRNEWNKLMSVVMDTNEKVTKLQDEAGKKLLTPKEVCEILKIGRSTYQRYVDAGIIEQIHLGKNNSRAFVKRAEIERLLDEGKI